MYKLIINSMKRIIVVCHLSPFRALQICIGNKSLLQPILGPHPDGYNLYGDSSER